MASQLLSSWYKFLEQDKKEKAIILDPDVPTSGKIIKPSLDTWA